MFKKIGHIILSVVLLISTMGMAVSKHYCGEHLVSVSLYENANDDSCCDMDNCCHNETKVYQVKENFSVPSIATVPVLTELEILGHNLFAKMGLLISESETVFPAFDTSPPVKPLQKALALKQVFLL